MRFGIFTLSNYHHGEKEILAIWAPKFSTIPNCQYDSSVVFNNFTTSQGISQIIHEEDKFHDLFSQAPSYVLMLNQV